MNNFVSTITNNAGKVTLESAENPIAIDIRFKGKIQAESNLPNGFFATLKDNRMIIVRFGSIEIPSLLFNYSGSLKIEMTKIYTSNSVSVATIQNNINTWNEIRSNYTGITSTFNSLTEENSLFSNSIFTTIYNSDSYILNKNLDSSIGKFKLDGKKYEGKVIYDSRGIYLSEDKKPLVANKNIKLIKQFLRKRNK